MLALIAAVLAVFLATRTPWLGVKLAATVDDTAAPWVRTAIGPSLAIPDNTRIARLSAGVAALDLRGSDRAPEPDTRFPTADVYREFLARQTALVALLAAPSIEAESTEGRRWQIVAAPERPLWDLPFTFWLQLIVGAFGIVTGASVWAFRSTDPAARYVALTGVGLLLSATAAAIYSSRELAIDGSLFRVLHLINGGGALLFCAAFSATLWHYPTRLGQAPAGAALLLLFAVIFMLQASGQVIDFDLTLRLPILMGFTLTAVFAALQWRASRGRPLERAALQWFLLAWLGGSSGFLLIVFVPALLGVDSGAAQAYAFALFLPIYGGLALGVLRYQLFNLGHWWLNAWSIVLGGALFAALDLLLLQAADLNSEDALLLALLIVPWIYLPLRQWLWRRFRPRSDALDDVLRAIAASDGSAVTRLWTTSLKQLFDPLQIEHAATDATRLDEGGTVLRVRGNTALPSLRLAFPSAGHRLFTPEDVRTAETLRAIVDRLGAHQQALLLSVQRERERMSRALHDDVGSVLLNLLHQSDGATREQARQALEELRLVLRSLAAHDRPLEDVLGWCRGDLHDWAESSDVQLRWNSPDDLPDTTIDPHHALLLLRTLRDLVTCARSQSIDRTLNIALQPEQGQLIVQAELHQLAEDPLKALGTLKQRAQWLGVELSSLSRQDGDWLVVIRLSLQTTA